MTLLFGAACQGASGPCPWGWCAVAPSPTDPTAALVTVEGSGAAPVWAEWTSADGSGATPGSSDAVWPIRGLTAGQISVTLTDGASSTTLALQLPAWPEGMPAAAVEGASADVGLWCIDAELAGDGAWACVDHDGIPRRVDRVAGGGTVYAAAPLPDGGSALVGATTVHVLDAAGRVRRAWTVDDLAPLRFVHQRLDRHEVLPILEGRWAGAVALLTTTEDVIDGTTFAAPGVVVADPASGAVWWDWQLHGALGDGVAIDPTVVYASEAPLDWVHANGLAHRVEGDGEVFWMSSRSQDRLLQIDVDTDQIRSVLGAGGTWELVGEPLSHQHAPFFTEDGHLVLFDNGNVRQDSLPWSRVVELALGDGVATPTFTWGSPDRADPAHFFLQTQGSARPTGDGAFGVTVSQEPRVTEVTREGVARWSAVWPGQPPVYRAVWLADPYGGQR